MQSVLPITFLHYMGLSLFSWSVLLAMMASSNWNIPRVTGPLCGDSPHKGQRRGALMSSLISAWTNGWESNRDAVNLKCHRGHYLVTVIDNWKFISSPSCCQPLMGRMNIKPFLLLWGWPKHHILSLLLWLQDIFSIKSYIRDNAMKFKT